MKTEKIAKQIEAPSTTRYFKGRSLQELLVETTQMLITDKPLGDKDAEKVAMQRVEPEPRKVLWEFYLNNLKICTVVKNELEVEINGMNYLCWLDWHNTYGESFIELYDSTIGFPDWMITYEDFKWFLNESQVA